MIKGGLRTFDEIKDRKIVWKVAQFEQISYFQQNGGSN